MSCWWPWVLAWFPFWALFQWSWGCTDRRELWGWWPGRGAQIYQTVLFGASKSPRSWGSQSWSQRWQLGCLFLLSEDLHKTQLYNNASSANPVPVTLGAITPLLGEIHPWAVNGIVSCFKIRYRLSVMYFAIEITVDGNPCESTFSKSNKSWGTLSRIQQVWLHRHFLSFILDTCTSDLVSRTIPSLWIFFFVGNTGLHLRGEGKGGTSFPPPPPQTSSSTIIWLCKMESAYVYSLNCVFLYTYCKGLFTTECVRFFSHCPS